MFLENLKLALTNMKTNKMRTFLSLLGIVIGVASVVAIMNLGESVKRSITDTMNIGGADIITVTPYSSGDVFNEALTYTFDSKVYGVEGASCSERTTATVRFESGTNSVQVMGVTSNYFSLMGAELLYGDFFTSENNILRDQVVVLGYSVAEKLFPAGDAIGKYISLYRNQAKKYLVVGVLSDGGDSLFSNYNNQVFIPYQTFTSRLRKVKQVGTYSIKVREGMDVTEVKKSVDKYLSTLANTNDYSVSAQAEISSMADSVMSYLTIFLAAIAAISLIVGGIGIMNIMLVTVVERTKEIGIRKALGAAPKTIKHQFLVEAIVLSLIGGIFGVVFGLLISYIVAKGVGWTLYLSFSSILLSLGFSSAVGIFFGWYPAAKASALDPIDALSYE